jgi:hypothetical protein
MDGILKLQVVVSVLEDAANLLGSGWRPAYWKFWKTCLIIQCVKSSPPLAGRPYSLSRFDLIDKDDFLATQARENTNATNIKS